VTLSDLVLWTSDLEVVSFTGFDGLRIMERDLTGRGPSLLLAAVRVDVRLDPCVVAFVPNEAAGKAIIAAVVEAYNSGARSVDIRQCVRPPTFEEMIALEQMSESDSDPQGGVSADPADAPGGETGKVATPPPDPDTIPPDNPG
jgi:hypothetical protein